MTKTSLKFFFIIFLLLTIGLFWDLIQPEITSTSPIHREIILKENIVEKFTTGFDYGYELRVTVIEKEHLNINQPFDIILKKNGKTILQKTQILNIDRNNHLIYEQFVAESGDDFELEISGIDQSLIGKNAQIYADVTGGGPSVGISLAKALKPYFWILDGILAILTIVIGIYSYRKKASR